MAYPATRRRPITPPRDGSTASSCAKPCRRPNSAGNSARHRGKSSVWKTATIRSASGFRSSAEFLTIRRPARDPPPPREVALVALAALELMEAAKHRRLREAATCPVLLEGPSWDPAVQPARPSLPPGSCLSPRDVAIDLVPSASQACDTVTINIALPGQEFIDREIVDSDHFLDWNPAAPHGLDQGQLSARRPSFAQSWPFGDWQKDSARS